MRVSDQVACMQRQPRRVTRPVKIHHDGASTVSTHLRHKWMREYIYCNIKYYISIVMCGGKACAQALFRGVMVSTPNYKSVGLGSNLEMGNGWTAHLAVHLPFWGAWQIKGYLEKPGEGTPDVVLALGSGVMASHSPQAQESMVRGLTPRPRAGNSVCSQLYPYPQCEETFISIVLSTVSNCNRCFL